MKARIALVIALVSACAAKQDAPPSTSNASTDPCAGSVDEWSTRMYALHESYLDRLDAVRWQAPRCEAAKLDLETLASSSEPNDMAALRREIATTTCTPAFNAATNADPRSKHAVADGERDRALEAQRRAMRAGARVERRVQHRARSARDVS